MPKTRSYGGEVDESYSNAFVFAKFVIHFARKFVEARERDGEWGGGGAVDELCCSSAIVKLDKVRVWIRIF